MTKHRPDEGWRQHVVETMLPRMEATAEQATGFTPGPANPQQLNFGDPHIAPPDDPLALLPDAAAAKMTALIQRAADLHSAIPAFEDVHALALDKIRHQTRIADLTKPATEGGFGLTDDSAQTVSEKRKLERVEKELARLTELKETRTVRWAAAKQLEARTSDWLLRGGIPHGCVLEPVADLPLSELLKKGERIADAVERYRHRLRELAADRHRVNSSPFPASVAKAAAKEFIDRLADAGTPNLEIAIEHNLPVTFATTRLTTKIYNVDAPGAVGYAETDAAIATMCWLWRDQMFSKICAGFDEISDDKNALDERQRAEALATIATDELAIQRSEVACIRAAETQNNEILDFRADTSPQAVLGVALRTVVQRADPPLTSVEHAYDIVQPGGGRR